MMRKIYAFGKLLFAVAVVSLFSGRETVKAEEADHILEGIYIDAVDVSGMSAARAKSALEEYMEERRNVLITLRGEKGSVEMIAGDMGLDTDIDTVVENALKTGRAGSLINRYKVSEDLKKDHLVLDLRYTIDKQKIAQQLYQERAKTNIAAEDNSLVRENGQFRFIPGKEGLEVDIVQSVYAISDFMTKSWNGTEHELALVSNVVQPRGSEEELAQVKDLLGTFSTNFSSSSANRAKNVENGVRKVDGTLLFPGEEFKFQITVSPFTQANGYELAGSYQNGTTVESFGGGICQVSTTLYNAVIRAELDITMRYNHSMQVAYVEPSMDAAIAGDYKDLRFRNNYDIPIYIEGYCNNRNIYFNIYGKETRASDREISFESETLSTEVPDTQYNLADGLAAGEWKVTQSAHVGCKAQLWKVVKVNGTEESRKVFNKSTYQPSPKIVEIGTMGLSDSQLEELKAVIKTKDEAAIRDMAQSFGRSEETPEQPAETEDEGEGGDTVEDYDPNEGDNSDEFNSGADNRSDDYLDPDYAE